MQEKKRNLFFTIRDRIYSGYYWPREKLLEMDLSKETKLSRTVIREVLKELAANDLVCIQPNKGAFVSEISHQKIKELIQLQSLLEGSAAYLATHKLNREKTRELHKLAEKAENVRDPQTWSIYNKAFHRVIITECGNTKLIKIIRDNVSFLKYWFVKLSTPEEMPERNTAHQNILKALEKKNADLVRELMEDHVQKALQDLLKRILDSNPNLVKLEDNVAKRKSQRSHALLELQKDN